MQNIMLSKLLSELFFFLLFLCSLCSLCSLCLCGENVFKVFLFMNESGPFFEKHLTVCKSNQTILDCLSENCPQISKQTLKLAMKYGAVWITPQYCKDQPRNDQSQNNLSSKTARIRRAKKILQTGDQVHLYYNEAILFSEIKSAKLVSDEGEYSIWNKPCGMFSQGGKWGDHTSITRWVELFGLGLNQLEQRPCFLVHRLDRATRGIILVAHSKQVANQFSKLFEQRKIYKQYRAIVAGQYPNETSFQILMDDIDHKKAKTKILSIDYDKELNRSMLTLTIETGRKHQIRKHLAGVDFPVIGDRFHGVGKDTEIDLQLVASQLSFVCPLTSEQRCYSI